MNWNDNCVFLDNQNSSVQTHSPFTIPPPLQYNSDSNSAMAFSPFDVDRFLTDISKRTFKETTTERVAYSSPGPLSMPTSPLPAPTQNQTEQNENRQRYEYPPGVMDTIIDTIYLRLYPTDIWDSSRLTAKQVVEQYFKRRSSKKMPFHYKLYNALQITSQHPNLVGVFGAQWITDTVFKIYRLPFANLLGVASINGALFNKQGSLPTHGFLTVFPQHLYGIRPHLIADVDNDSVRMFRHISPYFHINATESELTKCRWKNPRT